MSARFSLANTNKSSAAPLIRVMLVDDSKVARAIFKRILEASRAIEVTCEAEDIDQALTHLDRHAVDIILLDIEMPRRSGLDALPDIVAKANGAHIMVVSSFAEAEGPVAVEALSLGACDTLAKPGITGFSGTFSSSLLEKVTRLGRSNRVRKDHRPETALQIPLPSLPLPTCIAIGASTGGIPGIFEIISNLDPAIDCPIFITQHLPTTFIAFFAKQLAAQTDRAVFVAEDGQIIGKNCIYVAPGDKHLAMVSVKKAVMIQLQDSYAASRYCPSVDAMLTSVADAYSKNAIAIVLSGMGNDGAAGARCFNTSDNTIIVQDSDSSVVWGMPGAIVRENLTAQAMPPLAIANWISSAVGS